MAAHDCLAARKVDPRRRVMPFHWPSTRTRRSITASRTPPKAMWFCSAPAGIVF